MRILRRILAAVVVVYALWFGVVLWAMSQPPVRFGKFMRAVPPPLVWAPLPSRQMWFWARAGTLRVGDAAPDFTLPARGGGDVALSSFRGKRPVVLIFGSYT